MGLLISKRALRVRARMVEFANLLTAHRAELPYEEYRPMRSFETPFCHLPGHATDCSESTSMIARAAGAPTPYVSKVEGGYAGYTGTMLAKLPHISKLKARRGDFVVFGAFPGNHVVMLLQRPLYHRDPLVWSHGRAGVDVMPLSQMREGFPGQQVTFLRSVPAHL